MSRMSRIWVLTSGRTGDDKQSLRLAEALELPFDEKKIVFNGRAQAWRLMFGPSLTSVDQTRSSPLEGPWPEVVISSGWRQVPVVRWIKQQSGGQARLVQMNRPPGPKHFDLILSPPQYAVPLRDNVVRLEWPLQLPPGPEVLENARQQWKDRLDPFPHPWTVVLVGGNSYPFSIDRERAQHLFQGAFDRASTRGGSLMISTSRRTPQPALEVLRDSAQATGKDVLFYEWQAEAPDNPFAALLADGDEFVITPDSVSMLVEVARLGRPIAIAPHTRYRSALKEFRNQAKRLLHGKGQRKLSGPAESLSDLASLLGLKYVRNLESVSTKMIEQGWAGAFPEFAGSHQSPLPDDDFNQLLDRVRGFL